MADTLPCSEKTFSGTSVFIRGVECGLVNVPLHNIYLSLDLVYGPVAVGIQQTLAFKGVHLLIGNDLAGDKVVVNSLVTDTPCMDHRIVLSWNSLIFTHHVHILEPWQRKPC